jgi:hypothetical protein
MCMPEARSEKISFVAVGRSQPVAFVFITFSEPSLIRDEVLCSSEGY